MESFASNIEAIRRRAREQMAKGAVTGAYTADREKVLKVLNEVLATELVCALRYQRHYHMADGINSEAVKAEFLEHMHEEQAHADAVAKRIVQLRGEPDLNPGTLVERSHAQYAEGRDLVSMIEEDLVAERIAIESYIEIIRWLGEGDPTTRRLIEHILEKEEEHADDLVSLLERLPKKKQ